MLGDFDGKCSVGILEPRKGFVLRKMTAYGSIQACDSALLLINFSRHRKVDKKRVFSKLLSKNSMPCSIPPTKSIESR